MVKLKDIDVFLLNLEKDKARLKSWNKRFSDKFKSVNYVKGIEGKKLSEEDLYKNTRGIFKYFPVLSAVGCAMSHIEAWKRVLKSGKPGLIMEDDTVPLNDKIFEIDINIPEDYDIFYVGCLGAANPKKEYNDPLVPVMKIFMPYFEKTKIISEDENSTVYVPSLPLALHAYILNPESARKLLEKLDKGISSHLDVQMISFKEIKKYAIYPNLINQETFISSNNVSGRFPEIISSIFDNIKDSNGLPVSYKLNVGLLSYKGVTINGMVIAILILSLSIKSKKFKILLLILFLMFEKFEKFEIFQTPQFYFASALLLLL